MTEVLHVALLAILQGVTEFLPVSSSGHLVIAQSLLGLNPPGMRLEVILHLGTLLSIVIYYRRAILSLVRSVMRLERAGWHQIGCLALSTVPAVFFYLLFHSRINSFFEEPRAVGGFLVFTGFVLILLRWLRCGSGEVTAAQAFLVGMAQAMAVLPGVSRSGMTIAAARMAGIAPDRAAEFSLLMCLPLLVGAAALNAFQVVEGEVFMPWWLLALGAAIAALTGYLAIRLLVRLLRGGRFWMFGIYCVAAGLLTLCFLR